MGGVVGKVALVALGTAAMGAAAVEAAQKAVRAAAEEVFEAITEAAQAASHYMSKLNRACSSAAAQAYEQVKRGVAQAGDAVECAAARVSNRIFVLVEHVHGVQAARFVKSKLDGVNDLVGVGDVAFLVAEIVDDIKRFSSRMFPEQPFGYFSLSESPKARRAASSTCTAQIMQLLTIICIFPSDSVEKSTGFKVPNVAISVLGIAAQLAFDFLLA